MHGIPSLLCGPDDDTLAYCDIFVDETDEDEWTYIIGRVGWRLSLADSERLLQVVDQALC